MNNNRTQKNRPYNVYFAGDLFDQKHITGNSFLAEKIEKLSNGLYKCVLPQIWGGETFNSGVAIRNLNLKLVIEADLIILNFDGPDLDSGTVAEFVIAKMLDIPAVLLRTDLRNGGYEFGSDWNLMVEGYPRCEIVTHPAFSLYNTLGLDGMHQTIAQSVIEALKRVTQKQPLLNTTEEVTSAYRHVIKMCGGKLDKVVSEQLFNQIIAKNTLQIQK